MDESERNESLKIKSSGLSHWSKSSHLSDAASLDEGGIYNECWCNRKLSYREALDGFGNRLLEKLFTTSVLQTRLAGLSLLMLLTWEVVVIWRSRSKEATWLLFVVHVELAVVTVVALAPCCELSTNDSAFTCGAHWLKTMSTSDVVARLEWSLPYATSARSAMFGTDWLFAASSEEQYCEEVWDACVDCLQLCVSVEHGVGADASVGAGVATLSTLWVAWCVRSAPSQRKEAPQSLHL